VVNIVNPDEEKLVPHAKWKEFQEWRVEVGLEPVQAFTLGVRLQMTTRSLPTLGNCLRCFMKSDIVHFDNPLTGFDSAVRHSCSKLVNQNGSL